MSVMKVKADDGRIYLPKELREEFGDEFELIDRGDRLVLVPVPDDPLGALREEAAKSESSARELKESALEEGLEEAGR
jgi:bifunctional DNA-binding transcriptional regulator/antitoxin component of YhaV-PrlF toxin-antitoxin module